jgi:hypothetical protein
MSISKRFDKARTAGNYFNEANKYWKRAEQPFKAKDEFALGQDLIEVIRNCQLALAEDENYGDAYVLLANALLLAGVSDPIKANKERSWYLVTRAAAVIYTWYTLPNRDYPISKNVRQGEKLFQTILGIINAGELEANKYPMKLINSYREKHANDTISPEGLEGISDVLLNRSYPKDTEYAQTPNQTPTNYQWLEETLLPAHWSFLAKAIHGLSGASSPPHLNQLAARLDSIRQMTEDMQDTLLVVAVIEEISNRMNDAYKRKDWRQILGWLADIRIINDYCRKKLGWNEAAMEKLEKHWAWFFPRTINEARQAKDVDTMLLAIGYTHSLAIGKVATKLLGEVKSEVSERDMMFRMQNISENPIMMHEEWTINKTREFINEN